MENLSGVELLVFGFFIFYIIYIFWFGGSKKPKKVTTTTVVHRSFYTNPSSNSRILNKPPGPISLFAVSISIFILIMISLTCLSEWSEAVNDYNEESRNNRTGYSWDTAIADFIFTDADMGIVVGDNIPTIISPNGSVFWMTYLCSCLFLIMGIRVASNRRKTHNKNLRDSEKKLRPILRRLAMDPNGVIRGRIRLPEAVPISKPSKSDERIIILIYAISALLMIWTFISLGSYFNELATEAPNKKWGENMGPREDFQAFILISLLLLNTIAGSTVVKYLFAEYEGEDDSILPPSVRKQAEDVEEKRVSKLSTEPASADDVLKALAKEMEAAKAEAAFLRQELDETRDKVKGLEIELDEKKVELESIQEITKNMEKIVEENKNSGDKELSLQDSVMVGDNLFNGDKIDKQIINDPEAIARAAIEAYREGRRDSGKIDLDFD